MRRCASGIVVAFTLVIAGSGNRAAGAALTQQLHAVEDRDAFASGGTTYQLRADGEGALIVGSGYGNGPWRSVMEFSLQDTRSTIDSASLTFKIESITSPPAAYDLHGYFGDGVITLADVMVNNRLVPTRTTTDSTTIDVTAFLQQAMDAGATHAGFMFQGYPGGSGFSMRSSEPFANAPILAITSTPEPSSLAGLAIVGGTAWAARRRQRRQG